MAINTSRAFYKYVANFNYTGAVQSFTIPLYGTSKLECWGAQGGPTSISASYTGGLGGYSYGNSFFSQDKNLYIYVGGAGGGATHIASASGLLSTLSSNTSAVLIVAGGGGGARDQINLEAASRHGDGGSGGGTSNGIRLGSGYARITFVSAN